MLEYVTFYEKGLDFQDVQGSELNPCTSKSIPGPSRGRRKQLMKNNPCIARQPVSVLICFRTF